MLVCISGGVLSIVLVHMRPLDWMQEFALLFLITKNLPFCGKNVYRSATSTNQLIWVKFFFLLLLIILLCLAAWPSTLCLKLIFEMNAENTWVKKFSLPSLWIFLYIYIKCITPFLGILQGCLDPQDRKAFHET